MGSSPPTEPFLRHVRQEVSRYRAQVPPETVRRTGGAGTRYGNPSQRHPHEPAGPRLPVQRSARRRQNHGGAHSGESHQLHHPAERARRRSRTVPRLRTLPHVRGRAQPERNRDRRRLEQPRRRYSRPSRNGAHPAARRPPQGIHRGRGAYALYGSVQRLAENP